jgi:PKHD-type hydroxylase|tara:strand:+ start:1529 stop:2110 length:582 start_codon:yes stop_codon:yes gene_type:complete
MYTRPIFNPDLEVDQTNYYWFENGFSSKDISKIKTLTKTPKLEKATVINGAGKDTRNSDIKWLVPNNEYSWIYDTLMQYVQEANSIWKFNLYSIIDDIQYTEYKGGGGHYDWHIDIGPGSIAHRKVSIIVQLSDPSEYKGGILEINTGGGIKAIPQVKGSVVIFPSYLQHRVTPVTSGLRKSLVLWAGGEHYK